MLLWFLQNFFEESLITNLLGYITFRSLSAAILTFAFTVFLMPKFIRFFKRARQGQIIRDDGPESHIQKGGTPTMGGVLLIWSICLMSVVFCKWDQTGVWILLFSLVGAGFVGFYDDYLKLIKKNSKGINFRGKMLCLSVLSVVIVFWAMTANLIDPQIRIPFFKDFSWQIGPWFYLWGFLVIVGSANAVNLTDGLDGLAIVPVMTCAGVFIVLSYVSGHTLFAEYLQLLTIRGAGELAVVLSCVLGACLGFLWFNSHPAEIFMGDVGSLSLGALLGTAALLIHQELVLLIAGFLFVLEAFSVILQVGYYKTRQKRIFLMAPLHHHFELKGWPESKVIVRFWILSILFAVLALTTLKLR